MSDKIDLKDMQQRAHRLVNKDGLLEALIGLVFIFTGGSLSESAAVTPSISLFVIISNRIVEGIRERYTYPRIGYVCLPEEDGVDTGRGILTYVLAVMAVMVAVMWLLYGGVTGHRVYQWVPTGIGLMLVGAMTYMNSKTGDVTYAGYAAYGLISGLAFTWYNFPDSARGASIYMEFLGVSFIVFGAVKFILFRRNYPVVAVDE